MKNIEIKTTQNVVLQYELADLKDRILAFLIDLLCLIVGISILSSFGAAIFSSSQTAATIFSVFLISVVIFYPLALEVWNNGQSVGKMALRIQVIKVEGGKATFADYAARWAFGMVDIYFSLGGIAAIMVASSSKAQRLGDIIANTAVIKVVPKVNLQLRDLLSIHSQTSYSPVYNQAKQLAEEDVILIKTTLDRYARFKNDAHFDAINLLARRIKEILKLDDDTTDNRKFLQTILYDFVILTR
jgi:uncharacterized RDD family membrane protein YckC